MSRSMGWKVLLALGVVIGCVASSQAADKKIKVLMTTGDWKSQPWYQDVWMKDAKTAKAQLYLGRYIAQKVEEAAPGKFEFTDVPNYIAQQYFDADYLSQFDVVLIGGIMVYFTDDFQNGIRQFVKNGGGLIYCANHKWGTGLKWSTPEDYKTFEDILPNTWPLADDKNQVKGSLNEQKFQPVVAKADHPVVRGLKWDAAPPLNGAANMAARPQATVILKSPNGAPILTAWDYGKGRSVFSAAIFANDELSEQFGQQWEDFGKYYAQLFTWLAENSKAAKTAVKDITAGVNVTVDFAKPLNKFDTRLFSIQGDAGDGLGFENYQAMKLDGTFSRFGVDGEGNAANDNDDPNVFNWDAFKPAFDAYDKRMELVRREGRMPIAGFHGLTYNKPDWLWKDNGWDKCTDKQAAEIAEMVAALIEHANGGKGTDKNYKLNLEYVELGNEPEIDPNTMKGYATMIRAVCKRVHRDYPGVKVSAYPPYKLALIDQFLKEVGQDVDWFSFHYYGVTGDMMFPFLKKVDDLCKKTGRKIELIVTENDFWIQGRQKFDYMMREYLEAVQHEEAQGMLHYCMYQYSEPIYMFGVLWAGYGPAEAAGPKGTPMHDAYDALWIFRDFRGQRMDAEVTAGQEVSDKLLKHIHVSAAAQGKDEVSVVLYYDWAYDGTGFKDYAKGLNYPKVKVDLKLILPDGLKGKKLTISQATGEGFSDLKKDVVLKDGQKEYTDTIEIAPLTGVSVSVK